MAKYTIAMPGKLYEALMARESFSGDSALDRAALVAMQFATKAKVTRGVRYVVLASPKTLHYILDYLRSLLELAQGSKEIKVSEFGVTARALERVASQELFEVKEAAAVERKPVYHVKTRQLVGYLTQNSFIPA